MTMDPHTGNPKSTASIAGHPIHPMLIPFPIAFFVATFACDVAFWITGDTGWFEATMWLLGAGLILAGLAAVAGLTDVLGDARIRGLGTAWWHAGGNVLAVVIEIVNIFLRNSGGSGAVLPTGINPVGDCRVHPALHRLERLGTGLSPPCRCFPGSLTGNARVILFLTCW